MDMETPQGYAINLLTVTERTVRAVSVLRWNFSHLYVSRGLDVPDHVLSKNVKEVLNPHIQLRKMEGSWTKQIIGIFQLSTKCYWFRISPDISSLVCFWGQTCRPSVPDAWLLVQINLVEVQWKNFPLLGPWFLFFRLLDQMWLCMMVESDLNGWQPLPADLMWLKR